MVGAVDPEQTRAVPVTTDPPEDEADEDGSNRTRTYAIILAILILLLLGAGFLLARNLGYLGGAASFNLPNVTGKPVAQATATLKNDGLTVTAAEPGLERHRRDGDLHRPGAQLTGQEGRQRHPEGGRSRPRSPRSTVPAGLIGVPLSDGRSRSSRGRACSRAVVSEGERHHSERDGDQYRLRPPGTKVSQGSTVTLTVSSGQPNVPVPSVSGLDPGLRPGNVIGNASLTVGSITQPAVDPVPGRGGDRDQSAGRDLGAARELGAASSCRPVPRRPRPPRPPARRRPPRPRRPRPTRRPPPTLKSKNPSTSPPDRVTEVVADLWRERSPGLSGRRWRPGSWTAGSGPLGVRIDSGWNWTPSTARVRCRRPMMTPSEVVAVTSRTSGTESGSTTREW